MTEDIFITYLERFPRSFQPKLRRKLACKKMLETGGGLIFPDNIWYVFLTPHKAPKSLFDKGTLVWLRKKNEMLRSWRDPKKLLEASARNIVAGEKATLAILGLLFDLQEGTILFPRECYEIWIKVANRFGLWRLRYHLEDAVFKIFDKENFELVQSLVKKKLSADVRMVEDVNAIIYAHMPTHIKPFTVYNRTKNIFGVFEKMQSKGRNINDIYDIHGFRIITNSRRDVYEAVSALHTLWRHYPERYKDYIAHPKKNGYQSIHTVLRCLNDTPIEFQVRSREMDQIAVSGPANHARYRASRK